MNPTGFIAAIIRGSLGHKVVVLGLALLLAAFGTYRLTFADYDVFPDFAPPRASIQTEAPGLTAEQVEQLVTRPVETRILGVPGVTTIRSNSIQGLSDIAVVFDASADVFRARQQLSEALAGLGAELPQGVTPPSLTPLTSSTGTVLIAGVTSRTQSPMQLRTVADWTIRQRLLAVPGVAQLSIYGGATRQYQIAIDPTRLASLGLSLEQLATAAQRSLGIRGAGFIDNPNQRIVIEADDAASTARRLAETVVSQAGGRRLTLADLASISEAPAPPIGASLIGTRAGLQIIVAAQYGANTVKVAEAIESAISKLNRELAPQDIHIRTDIFRPTGFIDTALSNLTNALLIGGVLVIAVVLLFLWNLRMALIAVTAIPLSLLAGTLVLERLGYSLNTMTLGGLGIAVGLLVDDAVIVVENVYRRARLQTADDGGPSLDEVVLTATYEVRSAVFYATLAIALIFVPVLTIEDVAGRLFGPLGLAYILATLASLLVALTVTPVLCALLIKADRSGHTEPRLTRWLKERYERLLGATERRLPLTLAIVAGLAAAIFSVVPLLGTSFIPELKEGHYVIQMALAPGSSLDASTRVGAQVADALLKIPNVRLVAQRAGRAEQAADVFGANYSEIEVDLKKTDAAGQEATEEAIRSTLQRIPGAVFAVKTFLSDRLDEVVSGYTAPVVIRASGTDLDALDATAAQISAAVAAVPGAIDVQQQNPTGVPKLSISINQDALLRWGFNALDVLDAIRTGYQGDVVGQAYEGDQIVDAVLLLKPEARERPEAVGSLLLKTPGGALVPLSDLATIRETSGRYGVLHQGGARIQVVTAGTSDSDVGAFTTRVEEKVRSLRLPPGIALTFEGAAAAQSRSAQTLLVNSLLATVAMLLLLSLTVPSGRNLALILLNLPFAMVGGILALYVTGGIASLGALVGFVTLFGITLRNAIMMVSHYDLLTSEEGQSWTLATAIEGAKDRLSPILMTTLATALGLLPLALGSGEPGREIEGPMAVVILGGLFSSAALNLLVLPGMALRFGRFGKGKESIDQ